MHQKAENDKMQAAARAVQIASAHREAMKRAQAETKAEAEEVARQELKAAEERHEEHCRTLFVRQGFEPSAQIVGSQARFLRREPYIRRIRK